jgi:hypothetical protein
MPTAVTTPMKSESGFLNTRYLDRGGNRSGSQARSQKVATAMPLFHGLIDQWLGLNVQAMRLFDDRRC